MGGAVVILSVTVKPNSKRPGIWIDGESIEVRVAAPPRDGRANDAVRSSLARALGVPKRDIELVRGGRSRLKSFAIRELERDVVVARLCAGAGPRDA